MDGAKTKDIKIWRPLDAVIILVLLSGAVLCFFVMAGGGTAGGGLQAAVRQNGAVVKTISLSALDSPLTYTAEGDGDKAVTILMEPDGVRVTQSGCKDQICVKTGKLTRSGQTAVCLPAKVTVELISAGKAESDGIDAVTR